MEASSANTQALPAGTRIEEFVIERVLGSGGFGITYLAQDTRLNRKVVIKENLPVQFCFRDPASLTVSPRHTHGDDLENFIWSLENFSKEAAMLASLDHPGIVRVHRSFEAFGTAYFVMPFVEGVTFDELIRERQGEKRTFSEEELQGFLTRVLKALSYLHDRGIYHRDIKPGNLLITHEGIPVLIDFGSARQRLSERSMTVVESAGYTPFEQLQSRGNVGPWSDLYALGGTLVKAITSETLPKANDRVFDDPWQALASRSDLLPAFSASFLECIDRALALHPRDRWQDADEWRAALGVNSVPKPQAVQVIVEEPALPPAVAPPPPLPPAPEPEHQPGKEREFEIAPGVEITMCWIPPGEFMMGGAVGEKGRSDNETQHRVTLTQGFWLAKTEVTQAQWRAVMGSNPSKFKGDDLPVERVNWNDIAGPGGFIDKVNQAAAAAGAGRFSLPTEAQWEYACRAGTTGPYAGVLEQMAWHKNNSDNKAHPVGQKQANAWGLHDMHGNVWEWCADWYGPYPSATKTDPQGAASGRSRVYRGGSWDDYAACCRSAYRSGNGPGFPFSYVGFRPARSSVP